MFIGKKVFLHRKADLHILSKTIESISGAVLESLQNIPHPHPVLLVIVIQRSRNAIHNQVVFLLDLVNILCHRQRLLCQLFHLLRLLLHSHLVQLVVQRIGYRHGVLDAVGVLVHPDDLALEL